MTLASRAHLKKKTPMTSQDTGPLSKKVKVESGRSPTNGTSTSGAGAVDLVSASADTSSDSISGKTIDDAIVIE